MSSRDAAYAPRHMPHPIAAGVPARWRRLLRRLAITFGVFCVLVWVGTKVVEGPLRRDLERRVNASLKGYTATIGNADLQLAGFAIELSGVTVVQNALPNPPLVYLPSWRTSVQWRALLHGRLVADVKFTKPRFFVTFPQAEKEVANPTPASERGWQDAVEAVYPLEINEFRIVDGELTYYDTSGLPPVEMRQFSMRAENIRNVRSVAGKYPSPVWLRATLADGARLAYDGHADFLAKPTATVSGDFDLEGFSLVRYQSLFRHLSLDVHAGKFGASGRIETTAKQRRLAISRATLDGARIDYVRSAPKAAEQLGQAAKATTTAEAAPETRVDVERADIEKGTFSIVDDASTPPYRLRLDDTQGSVHGFSNQRSARRGSATIRGRFMDSGSLAVDAQFAPAAARPDFALDLKLEHVDLPSMNDFLRAQSGVDVAAGALSVYTELQVQNGAIKGYVKPLFKDVEVYNRQQDKGKSVLHQAYEAAVGAAAEVLTNRPKEQVATITDLSGPIENPNTSTWDVIVGLVRNAFIKAILPGLEPGREGSEAGTDAKP